MNARMARVCKSVPPESSFILRALLRYQAPIRGREKPGNPTASHSEASIIIGRKLASVRFPSFSRYRHVFASLTICQPRLAFPANRSDESSCAKQSAEKDTHTNMTNQETTTTATVAELGAHGAPRKAASKKGATPSKKGATRKKGAAKGPKTAKGAKKNANPAPAKEAALTPRAESKGDKILSLIRRPKGATLAELAKLTGWQNHSIRGYLSGTVGKKMGLTVDSTKREDGARVYSISK
jgi:Protein of unknown function (DUF3489)